MNTDLRTCSILDLAVCFITGNQIIIDGSLFEIIQLTRLKHASQPDIVRFHLIAQDSRTGHNYKFRWQHSFGGNIISELPLDPKTVSTGN